MNFADVGDPVLGVRRRVRGIEFAGRESFGFKATLDLSRVGFVGEVAGHQWLETGLEIEGGQDSVAIGDGLGNGRDWRGKVGHHDGPAKLARCVPDDRSHHVAIAKVDMPVVRPTHDQGIG